MGSTLSFKIVELSGGQQVGTISDFVLKDGGSTVLSLGVGYSPASSPVVIEMPLYGPDSPAASLSSTEKTSIYTVVRGTYNIKENGVARCSLTFNADGSFTLLVYSTNRTYSFSNHYVVVDTIGPPALYLVDGWFYDADTYNTLFPPEKIQLTISGTTIENKIYDGTTAAVVHPGTLAGLESGDTVTLIPVGMFATPDAVTQTVTVNYSITGTNADKYFAPVSDTFTGTITPKQLSISGVTISSKTYNANTTATVNLGNAIITGIVSGDDVAVSGKGVFENYDYGVQKNVSVTYSLSGDDAANYIAPVAETLKGNINKKLLTVTDANTVVYDKYYDGSASTDVSINAFSGVMSVDNGKVSVFATGTFVTSSTSTTGDPNAGENKPVRVVFSVGAGAGGDRSFCYAAPNTKKNLTANINPRPITISAPRLK